MPAEKQIHHDCNHGGDLYGLAIATIVHCHPLSGRGGGHGQEQKNLSMYPDILVSGICVCQELIRPIDVKQNVAFDVLCFLVCH
jgi:hypothetical protein